MLKYNVVSACYVGACVSVDVYNKLTKQSFFWQDFRCVGESQKASLISATRGRKLSGASGQILILQLNAAYCNYIYVCICRPMLYCY